MRRDWGKARMLSSTARYAAHQRSSTPAPSWCFPCMRRAARRLRADWQRSCAARSIIADRWIAATAIRLGIPLVSNDTIFKAVPGLTLESLA